MKRVKRLFIVALALCLMIFGGNTASAAIGWGDTIESAITIYEPGDGSCELYVPIDNIYDNDVYVINNRFGESKFDFNIVLTPPSGIDYDMQIIRVDVYDAIINVFYVYNRGVGKFDVIGTDIQAGEKVYVRVMSHGYNDYDPNRNYSLKFTKFD